MTDGSARGSDPDPGSMAFLVGGGAAADRILGIDWDAKPLGPISRWPQSLKTALGLLLHSETPRILAWGPDFTAFYNDAFAPRLGAGLAAAGIGRSLPELLTDCWACLKPHFDAALDGHGRAVRDFPLPCSREGLPETAYPTISLSPVFGEKDAIEGVLCDFHEQPLIIGEQEALSRENGRFRQLFDQAPIIMALVTADEFRFEYANEAYEELTGNRRVIGKIVGEILPEAEAQGFVKLLESVRDTGVPFQGRDILYRRKMEDGYEERFVDFIYQAVKGADGAVTGIMALGYDITEEHRSREKARNLGLQLAQAARLSAMGAMAATLAHELNQPLTAATNFLAGSRRGLESGEGGNQKAAAGICEAERQIMRAGDIIRKARSLVQGGLSAKVTSLSEIVDRAVGSIKADPSFENAEFTIEIPGEADRVCVDPVQIEQVLTNLFRNSCEAISGDKPEIIVRSKDAGPMVEVSVEDNGEGLNPDTVWLFDNFARSTKGGQGLGLAISRTIIERHGGRIEGANAPAGGAIFTFTLPQQDLEAGWAE